MRFKDQCLIVKGQVHRIVSCTMTGVGTKALELEGKQGLPTGAIRESLEVVTLGLECRFSRQREEALCNCLLSSGFSSWGKVWRSLEGGRLL